MGELIRRFYGKEIFRQLTAGLTLYESILFTERVTEALNHAVLNGGHYPQLLDTIENGPPPDYITFEVR